MDVVRGSRARSHGDGVQCGDAAGISSRYKAVQIFDGYLSFFQYYSFGRTAFNQ